MKHISKITAFMAFTLSLMLFAGCKKEYGPDKIPNFPVMDVAPVPKFTMDPDADLVIQNPEEFKSRFTLDIYFPEDQKTIPKSADISIVMNSRYDNIRKFKTGITTFPSTFDITGEDLADLFGINVEDIVPGYKFELRTDFTMEDGTVIPGFVDLNNWSVDPNTGDTIRSTSPVTASSDVNNWPDSKTSVIYNAVCPLDLDAFIGDAILEDPEFWEDTYSVKITREDDNVLVITGMNQDPGTKMRIVIDAKAFMATAEKQLVVEDFYGYTNLMVAGSGSINACDTIINMNLSWSVDQGGWNPVPIVIKRP